jgi:hypothetical protein
MQRGGPSGMFLLRLIYWCTIAQGVSEVFADNISSMHTTQPQLQRVSQVKWVICMQRGGPSGMFRLSACFGMFDFGMFKYCQRSACSIPHTHTLAARCWSCSWSRGRAQLRFSHAVQRRHDRFCFLHADFHRVVLVVLFWSLWPN